jgi:hypothetical protein
LPWQPLLLLTARPQPVVAHPKASWGPPLLLSRLPTLLDAKPNPASRPRSHRSFLLSHAVCAPLLHSLTASSSRSRSRPHTRTLPSSDSSRHRDTQRGPCRLSSQPPSPLLLLSSPPLAASRTRVWLLVPPELTPARCMLAHRRRLHLRVP